MSILDGRFHFSGISNSLTPILHQPAYIDIYCYFCFDLRTFNAYKNGIYINTTADGRIYFYSYVFGFHFSVSYVTEADVGIYKIQSVDKGFTWFTVIDVEGNLVHSIMYNT